VGAACQLAQASSTDPERIWSKRRAHYVAPPAAQKPDHEHLLQRAQQPQQLPWQATESEVVSEQQEVLCQDHYWKKTLLLLALRGFQLQH
jgi:hypothetical protein